MECVSLYRTAALLDGKSNLSEPEKSAAQQILKNVRNDRSRYNSQDDCQNAAEWLNNFIDSTPQVDSRSKMLSQRLLEWNTSLLTASELDEKLGYINSDSPLLDSAKNLTASGISHIKFQNIEGGQTDLNQLIDPNKKFTLIVFGASWCLPCHQEFARLNKIQDQFGNNLNLIEIGLNDSKTRMKSMIRRRKALELEVPNYDILIDDGEFLNKVFDPNLPISLPLMAMYDQSGNWITNIEGQFLKRYLELHQ